MKTMEQADAKFLRRILFALIVCTAATGGLAAYASASADQAGQVNFSLPVLMAR